MMEMRPDIRDYCSVDMSHGMNIVLGRGQKSIEQEVMHRPVIIKLCSVSQNKLTPDSRTCCRHSMTSDEKLINAALELLYKKTKHNSEDIWRLSTSGWLNYTISV